MRIAFFTEGYDPFTNGVVVLLKAYRQALEEAGHEVVVFAPEHHGRPAFEDRVVRMPSFYWCKKTYPCLRPFAKNERLFAGGHFDIIHSHHPFSCGLLAEKLSRKHGIPLVYTFHTLLTNYSGYFPGARKVAEQGLLKILRRHCERADAVTVSTGVMERWLRERGVTSPIQIVRPPITLHPAPAGSRERIRRRLGLREDEPAALCASRLSLEKSVDFLIRSVARLPKDLAMKVILVGSGPQEAQLRLEAEQLGLSDRMVFAGEVPHNQMGQWYAAADFFLFPSANDTLGLVLIEAMASGLPCVAIDRNGPTEVVRDGETGFLVPPREAAFAESARLLAERPHIRQAMGRRAQEWSHAQFGFDTALSLERAYEIARERFLAAGSSGRPHVFGGRRFARPKAKSSW
jgi:1,2-diacylglycerol 3-alpha-glucosyltransferase